MRIALGRRGDYAVRAVLDLARHREQGRRKSRQIAACMDIPEKYLPQVLAHLVHAGLVISVPGPEGGYRLSRPAKEVTLLEVIEVVEGSLETNECILRGGPCHWDDACALHATWSSAKEAFRLRLAATTFADLAEADAAIEYGLTSKPPTASG